ncbi:MAG: hypothetical protein H0V23_05955 [Nocardioidaceae bacterium]|nr:hypothetical protein [Nocardioidaceae bacterium]
MTTNRRARVDPDHTASPATWDAVKVGAKQRVADPARLSGADPGVDEHIWRPSKRGTDRAVTAMVNLTRDQYGQLHAGCSTSRIGPKSG